jgi:hypothetical protein
MKIDDTHGLLAQLNSDLESALQAQQEWQSPKELSPFMQSLMGTSPQETPVEIEKLKSALTYLSSDVGRGTGAFYDESGDPEEDNWIAAIWSAASVGGPLAKEAAREWSKKCPERYDEQGFEVAWNSYKPNHSNPIGIGSLYKRATELGWQQAQPPAQSPSSSKYKLLTGNDLRALLPVQWRLKSILPYVGLAAMYGPSASGKSFLGFDLGAAISEGSDWFGIRTTKSTVVYVALEGESGFKNRVAAWELENGRSLPPDMFIVMQPFHITNSLEVADLATAVPYDSVVIVDTLNRAAPTSDENSGKEMGEILESCKRLQALIGGLVILIHHTGKDTTRGARGHSSLFAALDGGIEVNRLVNSRSWSIAKAKDGEDGKDFPFKLKVHNLGKDLDGDEITSCTIEQALPNIFVKPPPQGAKQQAAFKTLKGHMSTLVNPPLGIAGGPAGVPCMKFEDAVIFLAGTLATTAKSKRTNEARRLLKGLSSSGHIDSGLDANADTWCWVSI